MLPTTPQDPEFATIQLACAGDRRAFGCLVEAYQAPLYNLCYRVLGNPHDAEEAAQEAFMRAYTRLSSYDPARSFKTWLFAIAHHYCIDRLIGRRLIWLSLDDEPVADTAALRSPAPLPDEIALRHERDDAIQVLLASLPPGDRSVLIMRYWHDLSYAEIAAATATTVSAVKSRLHRARCALATVISPSEIAPAGSRRTPLQVRQPQITQQRSPAPQFLST